MTEKNTKNWLLNKERKGENTVIFSILLYFIAPVFSVTWYLRNDSNMHSSVYIIHIFLILFLYIF